MIVAPLVTRELLRESRSRWHFAGRTLFVGALAGFIVLLSADLSGVRGRAEVQAVTAAYGRGLFTVWMYTQLLAVCALSTVRAASLADERRTGALPLLQATAIGDRGVITGTFASVTARAAVTMLLALPVLAMARTFGGFTTEQVALALAVTFVAALHSAAFTIMIAAASASTGAAVAVSILAQSWVFARLLGVSFGFGGPWINPLALFE